MLTRLHELTEHLHLSGIRACLADEVAQAQQQGTPIQEVLLRLLEVEYQQRQEKTKENRIKNAKMPWPWSLDTFPFAQQSSVNKSQVLSLAKLEFIQRTENIVFIGNPGTGKTGLAISLLRAALAQGYRGRFYSAQDLLNELYASLADKSTSSLLKTIANYDLIIIDELGYLTLTNEHINIFFKLIDMRYRKKSTIITTNLDYPQWYDVFQNKSLVDALLDRFRHYCTTLHITGPSLRLPNHQSSTV